MKMGNTNHPVDDIFSKGLSNFEVSPSSEVKKNIFSSPAAIKPVKPWYIVPNILYVSSALLVTSFLLYYFIFNNATKEMVANKQTNIVANTINKNSTETNIQENEVNNTIENAINNIEKSSISTNSTPVNLSTSQSEKQRVEDKGVNHVEQNRSVTTTPNQKNQGKQLEIITAPTSHDQQTQDKNFMASTSSKEESITNNTSNIVVANNQKKLPVVEKNESVADNNNTEPSASTIISPSATNITKNDQISLTLSGTKNALTLNIEKVEFPLMEKILVHKFENVSLSDQTFINKESDYHLKGLWYVEFKAGAFAGNYSTTSKNSEWDNAAKAKQELLVTSPGYDFQLNAVHQKNNWIMKGGLSYANYGESIKGKALLTDPYNETNISFNGGPYDVIIGGNYYLIDTLGSYLHYTYTQTDHIFISDSTLAWNTQNVLADVWDTTQVTLFDTLPKTILNNNIRYIQIPLSVGYVIPYGRFSIGLLANITPGYFISVKGSNMNAEQYPAIEPYKKSSFSIFTLSAGAELEFGYQINEGLMLSFSPFYKREIMPMYKEDNLINQKASNYGFRVGIRKLL